MTRVCEVPSPRKLWQPDFYGGRQSECTRHANWHDAAQRLPPSVVNGYRLRAFLCKHGPAPRHSAIAGAVRITLARESATTAATCNRYCTLLHKRLLPRVELTARDGPPPIISWRSTNSSSSAESPFAITSAQIVAIRPGPAGRDILRYASYSSARKPQLKTGVRHNPPAAVFRCARHAMKVHSAGTPKAGPSQL